MIMKLFLFILLILYIILSVIGVIDYTATKSLVSLYWINGVYTLIELIILGFIVEVKGVVICYH